MAPLFPGCDYEHWLIVMDKPGGEGVTKQQMIDCYIQTLAKVLGSQLHSGAVEIPGKFQTMQMPYGCLILNLVLHSSVVVIRPGEEVGKILRDIQLYNTMNLGGFSGLLMKAATLAVVIRSGLWENLNLTMLEYICNSMHRIGLLLGVVYEVFELQFFPNGSTIVWHDGEVWRAALDTQNLDDEAGCEKLANFVPLTNYR